MYSNFVIEPLFEIPRSHQMDLFAHLFFCAVFAYSIEYVKNRTKKICTKISYLLTTGNFERGSLYITGIELTVDGGILAGAAATPKLD